MDKERGHWCPCSHLRTRQCPSYVIKQDLYHTRTHVTNGRLRSGECGGQFYEPHDQTREPLSDNSDTALHAGWYGGYSVILEVQEHIPARAARVTVQHDELVVSQPPATLRHAKTKCTYQPSFHDEFSHNLAFNYTTPYVSRKSILFIRFHHTIRTRNRS
jgi:hypothetical protein